MTRPTVKLSDLFAQKSSSLNPALYPDEVFELYSVPAFDRGVPDVVSGHEIGSAKQTVSPGQVLLSKIVPHIRRAWIVGRQTNRRIIASSEWIVLNSERADPRYLSYVLISDDFHRHFMATVGGVGGSLLRAQRDQVAQIELSLPDLSDQRRVADALDALRRSIELHSLAITCARALKSMTMRQLFTRGLRGEPQKATEIGPVPRSWKVQRLGAIGRVGNGSTPKKSNGEYWQGGSYPWLTSARVYDREITCAKEFVTRIALQKCHLPQLAPSTVLVAITGQGRTLGHCAVLQIEASISQHLAYIAVEETIASATFVRDYLETQYDFFRQVASGGGSTKGALTCAFLRDVRLPLPTLAEQREITELLAAIEGKIYFHKRKKALLEELFKALLNGLMTGAISVSDLDLTALEDSPASVIPEAVAAAV